MYLLLILLISPAFGRPSSDQLDVGAEIDNQLNDIVDFNKEIGNLLNNSKLLEKVSKDLQEAEQNIRDMEAELKSLQYKIPALQNGGNYFSEYHEAKTYLRKTKQELRELAHRTVTDVRDLKLLLDALDNSKSPILLKLTIASLKDLMIETGERLDEARKKYRSANLAFENLISSVKAQNKIVDKKVSEVYRKFQLDKDYTEAVRYNCKIASWFTFGLCSLIHHYENEVPLEESRVEYEKLQSKTDKILERTITLNADIGAAIKLLSEEIELIDKWANSAERMRKSIDDYPEEYLRKYEAIRTAFKTGLDDLKKVAEKFLAQTKYIL